jgi:peroxiredoxin
MRSDIVPGAEFPDYELPDHQGATRRLSELQSDDPMCLILARGSFCPKDQRQLKLLAEMEPEIEVSYSRIVTISTDDVPTSNEWRVALGAHWPFLSDTERIVQKDMEIDEYTDPRHNPMVPHTIMLAPGLVVHSIYNGYWFWGRPTTEEIRRDLRAISKDIRLDWDLSTPGLREKWDEGDRESFWPYGREMP